MVCKLNTRCTILAATNPKGQYDPSVSVAINVALASPLLSRFDLVLVLMDTRNPQWDQIISSFILDSKGVSSSSSSSTSSLWPMEKMKAYFCVVKRLQPLVSEEANCILARYYQLQRRSDSRNAARTTIRMLESLSRLAEAHAKLMFRHTVTIEDAVVAVSVMECSMQGGALLGDVNALHTSFPAQPTQQYQSQCQMVLEGLGLPHLLTKETDRLSRLRNQAPASDPEPPQPQTTNQGAQSQSHVQKGNDITDDLTGDDVTMESGLDWFHSLNPDQSFSPGCTGPVVTSTQHTNNSSHGDNRCTSVSPETAPATSERRHDDNLQTSKKNPNLLQSPAAPLPGNSGAPFERGSRPASNKTTSSPPVSPEEVERIEGRERRMKKRERVNVSVEKPSSDTVVQKVAKRLREKRLKEMKRRSPQHQDTSSGVEGGGGGGVGKKDFLDELDQEFSTGSTGRKIPSRGKHPPRGLLSEDQEESRGPEGGAPRAGTSPETSAQSRAGREAGAGTETGEDLHSKFAGFSFRGREKISRDTDPLSMNPLDTHQPSKHTDLPLSKERAREGGEKRKRGRKERKRQHSDDPLKETVGVESPCLTDDCLQYLGPPPESRRAETSRQRALVKEGPSGSDRASCVGGAGLGQGEEEEEEEGELDEGGRTTVSEGREGKTQGRDEREKMEPKGHLLFNRLVTAETGRRSSETNGLSEAPAGPEQTKPSVAFSTLAKLSRFSFTGSTESKTASPTANEGKKTTITSPMEGLKTMNTSLTGVQETTTTNPTKCLKTANTSLTKELETTVPSPTKTNKTTTLAERLTSAPAAERISLINSKEPKTTNPTEQSAFTAIRERVTTSLDRHKTTTPIDKVMTTPSCVVTKPGGPTSNMKTTSHTTVTHTNVPSAASTVKPVGGLRALQTSTRQFVPLVRTSENQCVSAGRHGGLRRLQTSTNQYTPAVQTSENQYIPAVQTSTNQFKLATQTSTNQYTPAAQTSTVQHPPAIHTSDLQLNQTSKNQSKPAAQTSTTQCPPAVQTSKNQSKPAAQTSTTQCPPAVQTSKNQCVAPVECPGAGDLSGNPKKRKCFELGSSTKNLFSLFNSLDEDEEDLEVDWDLEAAAATGKRNNV